MSARADDTLEQLADEVHRAVLARNGRMRGAEVQFTCPNGERHAHGDAHPSASWNRDKKVWRCAVCDGRGGVKALALQLAIVPPRSDPFAGAVGVWVIRGRDGREWAQHVRFNKPTGKVCRWWRDGRWGLGQLPLVQLPLYRSETLASLVPGARVVVTEGEPACDALARRDIVAVATTTGAGCVPADAVLRSLQGFDVVLWADSDAAGRRHMDAVAGRLLALGTAPRLLQWDAAPKEGADAANFVGADDELQALIDGAAPWTAEREGPTVEAAPTVELQSTDNHLTDVGNGRRLVARHGADLRFCVPWKCWLVWDGARWVQDPDLEVMRRAKDTALSIYAEAASCVDDDQRKRLVRHAMRSEHAGRLAGMVQMAQSEVGIPITPSMLDADPWLFNVRNGTIDLRTGTLRPHRREDLITKCAPVDYDPAATLDLWDRFLRDVTGGDAALEGFLQRAVGYSLTGTTTEEVLLLVHGPAASGKSTFLDAIRTALGDYAKTADFETFLARKGDGGVRNDVARLAGARFVSSIEVDRGKHLAEGLVKQLTGGDTVAARFLYGEFFEFKPQFTLWLAANHAPKVSDTDSAMWRRILRVPFDRVVPPEQRDPSLKATLSDPTKAGPAILAWAVRGCLAWQRDRLGVPPCIAQATATLRAEMDPFVEFWAERCIFEPGWVSTDSLFAEYQEWARANGIRHPLRKQGLSERLKQRTDCAPVKRNHVRGWEGVRLRSRSDDGDTGDTENGVFGNSPRIPLHGATLPKVPSTVSPVSPAAQNEASEWMTPLDEDEREPGEEG